MRKKILIISLISSLFLVSGCIQQQGGEPISPIKIEMNMLQAPKLNDTVDISFKISASQSALPYYEDELMEVELLLPEGFEYVSGDFEFTNKTIYPRNINVPSWRWIGDAININNKEKTLNAKIKAIKVGEYWQITSGVIIPITEEGKWTGQDADADVLFVTFNENSGEISRERPYEPSPLIGVQQIT